MSGSILTQDPPTKCAIMKLPNVINFAHCRRLYHWMTYLLLFQNLFVGILSAALRVLLSMVFGFLLITRLDRVLFMKGFEDRDDGIYFSFIYNNISTNDYINNHNSYTYINTLMLNANNTIWKSHLALKLINDHRFMLLNLQCYKMLWIRSLILQIAWNTLYT